MGKTKKSLLFSGLALMMSALLLAGTTFAWFTDSVTNKGNTIQSGNLDVIFQYKSLTGTDGYQDVTEDTPLFKNMIWEPGRSNGYDFHVQCPSTYKPYVAFNYQLEVSNIQVSGNTDITKMLDVYVVNNDKATSINEYKKVGTLEELKTGKVIFSSDKVMEPGWHDYFSVVICMNKDAGNEYQNCGVSFDLNLVAKQATHETDGFGNNDYDANAEWPEVANVFVDYDSNKNEAENGAALQAALDSAKDGDVIAVGAGEYDVTTTSHNLLIENDNVTIIGTEGTVISSKYTSGAGDCQQTIMIKGDNVTLKNLTIDPVEEYANKTLEIMDAKNTVIENCTINATGAAVYIGGKETANYVIRNNVINGGSGAICITNGAGGVDDVNGAGTITGNTINGSITLNGLGAKDSSYAWMLYDLKYLPEISGNNFTAPTVASGMEYYLRSLSYVESGTTANPVTGMGPMGMVSPEYVNAFVANNTLAGNDGYAYDIYATNSNFAYYGKTAD